jgi:AcrR family transcriptional regulator
MVTQVDIARQSRPERRPPAARDRAATRGRLIQAVGTLLSRRGFTALGINAVAREAGVDKVLIYRYFGGLPELIAAFGREGDFWPSIEELAGGDIEAFARLAPDEKMLRLAGNFIAAIKRRPLTQEIMAWELVERTELTAELETIRETMILGMIETIFPALDSRIDMQAVTAIIGAAVSYLVTRSRHIRWYSGVDLQSEEGWKRLEDAIGMMIRGVGAPIR